MDFELLIVRDWCGRIVVLWLTLLIVLGGDLGHHIGVFVDDEDLRLVVFFARPMSIPIGRWSYAAKFLMLGNVLGYILCLSVLRTDVAGNATCIKDFISIFKWVSLGAIHCKLSFLLILQFEFRCQSWSATWLELRVVFVLAGRLEVSGEVFYAQDLEIFYIFFDSGCLKFYLLTVFDFCTRSDMNFLWCMVLL